MNPTNPAQHRQAIWMLLLANVMWSLSFPLIKGVAMLHERLIPGSSSAYITAFALLPRFALGALIVGCFCLGGLRTLTRSEWRQGLGLGVFALLGMVFQIDGLQYIPASTSAFLTQFYAIMIPIFLALRARRLPPWTVWVACVLVLAGVGVLARLDWSNLKLGRGEWETLLSSVFFMCQILWLERKEFSGNRPLPVTTIMFGVQTIAGAVMVATLAPAGANVSTMVTNGSWIGFTLGLTLLCTVGPFTIMNIWQPRISATEAGLLYCAEPMFTAVVALFVPAWLSVWGHFDYANETATRSLLIGGGLITAANVLVQLKPVPKESVHA